MKILVWLFRFVILVVLVWLSVKNSSPVTLYAYPYSWEAPLVLIILAFFAAGAVLGLLASLGSVYRLKREVRTLRRQLKAQPVVVSAAVPEPAPSTEPSQALPPGTGGHGV